MRRRKKLFSIKKYKLIIINEFIKKTRKYKSRNK